MFARSRFGLSVAEVSGSLGLHVAAVALSPRRGRLAAVVAGIIVGQLLGLAPRLDARATAMICLKVTAAQHGYFQRHYTISFDVIV
jgi:hypothetical protein